MRVPGRVHCECSVLAELDRTWRTGDTVIPHVGVSKPPCAFCSEYFAAYRTVTEHDVTTRGTDGDTVLNPWRCPTLEDEAADDNVRVELSARLRALLRRKVETFASSVASQITTASDDLSSPLDELGAPFSICRRP